jgi:hypothetical protein
MTKLHPTDKLVDATLENAKLQILICKSMCNAIENKSSGSQRGQDRVRALNRAVLLATILLSLSSAAPAQAASSNSSLASSNIFAGYSFLADNLFSGQHADLSGWHISAEKKYLPYFGLVGDISGLYGSTNSTCASSYQGQCLAHATVNEYTFQTGIRGSFAASNIRPFGEALFGAARTSENGSGLSDSNLGFTATLGAGLDCRLTRILGCRLVVDYIVTGNFANARQNSIRASTGLVVRF